MNFSIGIPSPCEGKGRSLPLADDGENDKFCSREDVIQIILQTPWLFQMLSASAILIPKPLRQIDRPLSGTPELQAMRIISRCRNPDRRTAKAKPMNGLLRHK
jgi:hypothetical protein